MMEWFSQVKGGSQSIFKVIGSMSVGEGSGGDGGPVCIKNGSEFIYCYHIIMHINFKYLLLFNCKLLFYKYYTLCSELNFRVRCGAPVHRLLIRQYMHGTGLQLVKLWLVDRASGPSFPTRI